jgi:nucleoside-diphosphate-sugar epimerase
MISTIGISIRAPADLVFDLARDVERWPDLLPHYVSVRVDGREPAAVVARFVALARAGQPLVVDGDGSQSRQFVYVEDLAEGVVAALNTPGASGVYNLVGEESTSIVAIAEHVRELVAAVPIEHVPGRLADLQPIQASGERAARELGWRTRTPFEAGLKRYLDWLTETKGSPSAATESRIEGSAADVRRQEPGEL